jgi:hypothetical protein
VYSVKPLLSTRMVPRLGLFAVLTTTAEELEPDPPA